MLKLNQVNLIGNLTRDPELKYLDNGSGVCEFGLALNHSWKVKNEWKEKPIFVDVTCWAELADRVAEKMSKGQNVLVQGRLDFSEWPDANTGAKRNKISVVAHSVMANRTGEGPSS